MRVELKRNGKTVRSVDILTSPDEAIALRQEFKAQVVQWVNKYTGFDAQGDFISLRQVDDGARWHREASAAIYGASSQLWHAERLLRAAGHTELADQLSVAAANVPTEIAKALEEEAP